MTAQLFKALLIIVVSAHTYVAAGRTVAIKVLELAWHGHARFMQT
jgi:hypothetical protein